MFHGFSAENFTSIVDLTSVLSPRKALNMAHLVPFTEQFQAIVEAIHKVQFVVQRQTRNGRNQGS